MFLHRRSLAPRVHQTSTTSSCDDLKLISKDPCQRPGPQTMDVEEAIQPLLQLCRRYFESPPPKTHPLWTLPTSRSLVARKWRHLFYIKNTSTLDVSNLFQSWYPATQYHKLCRELRRYCQQKKRDKLNQITQEAAQASRRHDSRALYEAIRILAPKQPRRLIRFRSDAGDLQPPDSELNLMLNHFFSIFTASTSEMTSKLAHPFPLEHADIVR